MNDKIFVDTNLWIYAHLEESGNDKSATAFKLLQPLENFVVSTADAILSGDGDLRDDGTLPIIRATQRKRLNFSFTSGKKLIQDASIPPYLGIQFIRNIMPFSKLIDIVCNQQLLQSFKK